MNMLSYCVLFCISVLSAERILLSSPPLSQERSDLLKGLIANKKISNREKRVRASLLVKAERVARIHNTNHDRRYNQKLNKFSMMTKKEKSQYLGIQNITSTDDLDLRVRSTTEQQLTSYPVPHEFNHRDHGHVTSVKNQKSCGSCWAFAAAGAFEGSYSSATKVLKSFSAKELLDCSYPAEKKTTKGCRGGHYKRAWLYIGEKGRLASAWDIPYHPIEHDCSKWDGKPNGIRNARYSTWEKSSSVQESVKRTIYSNTPAVMFILEDEFYGYDKGHYDGCSDFKKSKSYHAIILVGYGPDYWEGKNSWGWEWGNKGFVKFTREIDNICKILSRVMYPVVLKEDRGEEDEPDILPDEDLVDIAQGKEVTSSDWDVVTAAVDGDEATCYTTSETSSPSFKINFGKKYRVQRVEITTNTASGLIGSKVYVGEMGSYLDDIIGIVEEVEDGKVVLRPAPTEGSWLYWEQYDTGKPISLSLCEIKVFAVPSNADDSTVKENDSSEEDDINCPSGTTLCADGVCRHIHMC